MNEQEKWTKKKKTNFKKKWTETRFVEVFMEDRTYFSIK